MCIFFCSIRLRAMSYSSYCACADDHSTLKFDTTAFACSARVTHSHLTPLFAFFLIKNPKHLATFFAYPDRAQLCRRRIECAIAEFHAAPCTTRVIRLHSARRLPWHHRVVICVEFRVSSFAYSDRAHRALSNSATNSQLAHTNMSRKFAIFAFAAHPTPPSLATLLI